MIESLLDSGLSTFAQQAKLSEKLQKELRRMHDTEKYSISDRAELIWISRSTVYRTLARAAS